MMTTFRAFTGGLLLLAVPIAAAGPREPVALVYQVSGEAQRTAPGRSPEPLRLYDRLPAKVTLELRPGARVSLAFAIGKRYELSGPASATLGKEDLAARSGGVKALAPVSRLPRLEPIAASEKPGQTPGAILIRGGEAGSKENAEARERLRNAVEALGDDDARALLEAVDHVLGLAAKAPLAADAPCPLSTPGLVIETVTPESAAFRAGLMPGDRLFTWCKASGGEGGCAARGDLRTPFDWLDLQMEDVQRGGVIVEGTRGSESRRWSLLPTFQGLTLAPLFQGELGRIYQSARDREKAGDPASAARELERAEQLAEGNHCADTAVWLQMRAAQLHDKARQPSEADSGFQAALEKVRALKSSRVAEHIQMSWSETLMPRGDLARAREQLESALNQEEKEHPESLGVATLLTRLGNVAQRKDDLAEMDRLYRRADDLVARLAPGSGAEAAALNNLAVSEASRANLAQAEQYATRALAIREKLTPESDAIVPSLLTYGSVLYSRGDMAGAEAAFLRAKKILERFQLEGRPMATALHNLGEIAFQRGDDDAAESLFRRELALFEKLDSSGNLLRDGLMGLGQVAVEEGRGEQAAEHWQHALAISERLTPGGPKSAWCLRGLAAAAKLRGRATEAEELSRRALAIWEKINPEAVDAGSIHLQLGDLLLERGDLEASEAEVREAIRIYGRYGAFLPDGYQTLARVQARRRQAEEAAKSYQEAIEALEAQRGRLGGAQESQWLYGSSLGDLYLEAAEHQIALGRKENAFALIEKGRARGFQKLLAQRDLRFARELPQDLYVERRRLNQEYDKAQEVLRDWLPAQGMEKLEELQGRLRDLRLEQAALQEKIRSSSPRLAALENPTPLDLASARSTLDSGSALLEYAVGERTTWLFVVQSADTPGPGLSVFRITTGEKALRQEVERFRNLLKRPGSDRAALRTRARHLYDLLVRPAAGQITKAKRIIFSSDGPLHTLPFAALMKGNQYLVEWKPIHSVLSATVYAELKQSHPTRRDLREERLDAFGAPNYPRSATSEPADPEVREAQRGWGLLPLPSSRKEVEAIVSLYPQSHAYLGRDATEERAKSLGPDSGLIHFACHGLLDERFPLNSALALTLPEHPAEGQDNGLLQAWEIFESMHLDADLVTLSACDTALGKEMGGEGLVGLTRAFQYAGARSVLASLWGVADYSTARFMERFYRYLRSGKPKDEALRAAQIDQIRQKGGSSHPFFWAAFELNGDWR
jgi:CHAT domain-containing protein/Tfp pilus assembly protein PilF